MYHATSDNSEIFNSFGTDGYDIYNTVFHEFGHTFNMKHTYISTSPPRPVMSGGGYPIVETDWEVNDYRNLTEYDIRCAKHIGQTRGYDTYFRVVSSAFITSPFQMPLLNDLVEDATAGMYRSGSSWIYTISYQNIQ